MTSLWLSNETTTVVRHQLHQLNRKTIHLLNQELYRSSLLVAKSRVHELKTAALIKAKKGQHELTFKKQDSIKVCTESVAP
nr:hypothetical protein VCHA53O474_30230 [Vibrio chagasii]